MKTEYLPPEDFDPTAVYMLIDDKRLCELKPGDFVKTDDGVELKIAALYPPHKVNSSGKVSLIDRRSRTVHLYYPSVIGAHFEQMKSKEASND